MPLKSQDDPIFSSSREQEDRPARGSDARLQASLMLILDRKKPMTIEDVVAAFPSEKWTSIFEALAHLHRQERIFCRMSERELELTAASP